MASAIPAGDDVATTDLRRFVRWYDDALPASFCARIVDAFSQAGNALVSRERGWRAGLEASGWTELDLTVYGDAALKAYFDARIDDYLLRYNQQVKLPIAVPDRCTISELRVKRYRPATGEQFQLHFDSLNAVSNRYLVFLWYLNDVAKGGETDFPELGLKVSPRAGRLLIFPPYWMYQHAGLPPESGDKFILSTYLLFPNRQ